MEIAEEHAYLQLGVFGHCRADPQRVQFVLILSVTFNLVIVLR